MKLTLVTTSKITHDLTRVFSINSGYSIINKTNKSIMLNFSNKLDLENIIIKAFSYWYIPISFLNGEFRLRFFHSNIYSDPIELSTIFDDHNILP